MRTIVAVSRKTALRVRDEIVVCESCTADAEIPLSWVLDAVTSLDGAETDYILTESLKCPRCFTLIDEGMLLEWP